MIFNATGKHFQVYMKKPTVDLIFKYPFYQKIYVDDNRVVYYNRTPGITTKINQHSYMCFYFLHDLPLLHYRVIKVQDCPQYYRDMFVNSQIIVYSEFTVMW